MISAPEEEKITALAGKDNPILEQKVLHDPIAKEVGESVAPPSLPENLGENIGEMIGEKLAEAEAYVPKFSEDQDTSKVDKSAVPLKLLHEKMQKMHPQDKVNLN